MCSEPLGELENLRKTFLSIAGERVKQMKKALETGDFQIIQLYAHQLKGSGEAFGFWEITEISKQIEQRCILNPCPKDELCEMVQKLSDTIEKFKSRYTH